MRRLFHRWKRDGGVRSRRPDTLLAAAPSGSRRARTRKRVERRASFRASTWQSGRALVSGGESARRSDALGGGRSLASADEEPTGESGTDASCFLRCSPSELLSLHLSRVNFGTTTCASFPRSYTDYRESTRGAGQGRRPVDAARRSDTSVSV